MWISDFSIKKRNEHKFTPQSCQFTGYVDTFSCMLYNDLSDQAQFLTRTGLFLWKCSYLKPFKTHRQQLGILRGRSLDVQNGAKAMRILEKEG